MPDRALTDTERRRTAMAYGPNLAQIPLAEYRDVLKRLTLTPGRRPLTEDIDARFAALERQGIRTAANLAKALASPARIAALAVSTDIPAKYLTLLKRELGSLTPKPVPLASFTGVDGGLPAALARRGIQTSKAYYESEPGDGGALYALCDLVRINGVGAAAAAAFYAAGYRCAQDVADTNAETLLEAVTAANREHRYYGAKLGVKDMRFCIEYASLLVKYGGSGR